MHGWLNIDKPLGMSSAQVVGKIKWLLKPAKPKIGHAGTLDPLASGVLPVALGEATKTSNYMMGARKGYRFTVQFGAETETDDKEGAVTLESDIMPSQTELETVLTEFSGEISQIPPAYSALKVDGKRAYALARAGEEVVLQARNVMIHALTLKSYDAEAMQAAFVVTCGKGTYVRSLARDIARKCNAFGHVALLERTQVGNFHLSDAISLDFLEKMVHKADSDDGMVPWLEVLKCVSTGLDDIPAFDIDTLQARSVRHGQGFVTAIPPPTQAELFQLRCGDDLVAIATIEPLGNASWQVVSKRVFNSTQ